MSASSPVPTVYAPQVRAPSVANAGVFAVARRLSHLVVAFAAALVYVAFPTRNYYWDGISFASSVEAGFSRALIHPHHLLFNLFGYVLYHGAQWLGWHGRALEVLQIANCLMSVGCALLLFRFLKRTLQSRRLATVLISGFMFSATWWKYSTDADAYIPTILLLLVCLNLLLAVDRLRPGLIALTHAASMCLHQLAVFFFPVVIAGILVRSEFSWRQRLLLIFRYSSLATLTTLAINYYCFHLVTGSFAIGAFLKWLTAYVQGPDSYSFSFDLINNLRYSMRSQVRLLFEGRLNWIVESTPVLNALLIGALIGLLLFLAVTVFRSLMRMKLRNGLQLRIDPPLRPLAAVALIWVGVYTLFLFFWYPYFSPYRLFLLPPLAILCGVLLVSRSRTKGALPIASLSAFVMAMALSNFVFFIFPLAHAEKYPPLTFAMDLNSVWTPQTVVYFAKSNADNQLVRYFNPRTTWRKIDGEPGQQLGNEIAGIYESGGNVWMEASAWDEMASSPLGREWLSQRSRAACSKDFSNGPYTMRYVQIFTGNSTGANCVLTADEQQDSFK